MNYNENISLAPIIIFAYNRPEKLKLLLDSLEKNQDFKKSDLIFYIDNIKYDDDKINNQKVIEIASNNHSAKSVVININRENLGLKENILNGINKTFEIYKSAIFLEDDLYLICCLTSWIREENILSGRKILLVLLLEQIWILIN